MSYGIQVFNADGSLQFDTSNRLYRTLTSVITTGTSDGSVSVPAADQGTVVASEVSRPEGGVTPTFSLDGTTVSWSFGSTPPEDRRSADVLIAVF